EELVQVTRGAHPGPAGERLQGRAGGARALGHVQVGHHGHGCEEARLIGPREGEPAAPPHEHPRPVPHPVHEARGGLGARVGLARGDGGGAQQVGGLLPRHRGRADPRFEGAGCARGDPRIPRGDALGLRGPGEGLHPGPAGGPREAVRLRHVVEHAQPGRDEPVEQRRAVGREVAPRAHHEGQQGQPPRGPGAGAGRGRAPEGPAQLG
ncbi:MAG: hypothetical protein ACK559_01655, partial [bacterium]